MSDNLYDREVSPIIIALREIFQKSLDPRFLYTPGPDGTADKDSLITIHGAEEFNPAMAEVRPGISVEGGDMAWQRSTMNDQLAERLSPTSFSQLDVDAGQAVCHCYAKTRLVSAHLGALVYELVHSFKSGIRTAMGYYEIDSVSRSKPARYRGKDGAGPEFRSTAVVLRIALRVQSTVTNK